MSNDIWWSLSVGIELAYMITDWGISLISGRGPDETAVAFEQWVLYPLLPGGDFYVQAY